MSRPKTFLPTPSLVLLVAWTSLSTSATSSEALVLISVVVPVFAVFSSCLTVPSLLVRMRFSAPDSAVGADAVTPFSVTCFCCWLRTRRIWSTVTPRCTSLVTICDWLTPALASRWINCAICVSVMPCAIIVRDIIDNTIEKRNFLIFIY